MSSNSITAARQLRARAERRTTTKTVSAPELLGEKRLVHELQVHRVELEMQNEELNRAIQQTDAVLQRYTALYDFAPVSCISLDLGANVTHANIAAARLLGVERQRLIEGNLGFFVVAEDRTRFSAFLEEVAVKACEVTCFLDLMSVDKGVRGARLTATLLPAQGMMTTSILLHVEDMTENEERKRRLEEALMDVDISQRNASIGTWIIDLVSDRWTSSQTFNEMHAVDGTVERTLDAFLTLVHPADRPKIVAALREANVSERPFEVTYRTSHNGFEEGRQMVACGIPQRGGGENPARLVCTSQDVTDREKYKIGQEAAERSSRQKDVILADVSHELRAPLTSILLRANLLQRGSVTDEKVRQCGDLIAKAAKYQSLLIEDLLDISRISTGALRVANDPVNLRELVISVVDTTKALAEQKNIALHAEHMDSDAYVAGDRLRLSQVLSNLINNALKFTPPEGKIVVKLETHEGWVNLSVEDTGQGVAAEFLPHLFERFVQDRSVAKGRHTGLGLGLAIAQEIVDAHRGTISADSEGKGCGSKFTMSLPLRA